MSDADKSEELTELVTETLLRRGVLSEIQAKVRAEVYLALEEQRGADEDSGGADGMGTSPPSLQRLAGDAAALKALELVHQFLAHYGLAHTKSVLEAECPLLDVSVTSPDAGDDDDHDIGGVGENGMFERPRREAALVSIVRERGGAAAARGGSAASSAAASSAAAAGGYGDPAAAVPGEDGLIEGMPAEVYRARQLALKKLRTRVAHFASIGGSGSNGEPPIPAPGNENLLNISGISQ